MTMIEGEYYTVNPQAIRTSLDVYGENVRKVVPIHSEEFGLAMTVWVGAMSESRHGSSFILQRHPHAHSQTSRMSPSRTHVTGNNADIASGRKHSDNRRRRSAGEAGRRARILCVW